jgi:hypothetical protein
LHLLIEEVEQITGRLETIVGEMRDTKVKLPAVASHFEIDKNGNLRNVPRDEWTALQGPAAG